MSVYDILSRNKSLTKYFQLLPHQVSVTDSQASALLMEEQSLSKVIKVEIFTLKLSDEVKR